MAKRTIIPIENSGIRTGKKFSSELMRCNLPCISWPGKERLKFGDKCFH
jgi:hypothetical protein